MGNWHGTSLRLLGFLVLSTGGGYSDSCWHGPELLLALIYYLTYFTKQ